MLNRVTAAVTWVPLGALLVSLSTLVHLAVTNRRKAAGEDLEAVTRRLGVAEEDIRRCTADRADLRTQLFQTMTDLTELRRTRERKPARR